MIMMENRERLVITPGAGNLRVNSTVECVALIEGPVDVLSVVVSWQLMVTSSVNSTTTMLPCNMFIAPLAVPYYTMLSQIQ